MTTSPFGGGATSGLMRAVAETVTSLLRLEIRQAQEEMSDKARNAGKGAALLGGAGVVGLGAFATSITLMLRILERVMPRPAAAAVATATLGGAAAVLAVEGVTELRRIRSLLPEETMRSVKDDIGTVTGGS